MCGGGGGMCRVLDIVDRNSSVGYCKYRYSYIQRHELHHRKSLEIQISIDYHTLSDLVLVKIILQIRPLAADARLPSEWNYCLIHTILKDVAY